MENGIIFYGGNGGIKGVEFGMSIEIEGKGNGKEKKECKKGWCDLSRGFYMGLSKEEGFAGIGWRSLRRRYFV